MPNNLTYSTLYLNRASQYRQNTAWLHEKMHSPDLLLLIVWNDLNLITTDTDATNTIYEPTVICGDMAQTILDNTVQYTHPMFLGLQAGRPVFAVDLSCLTKEEVTAITIPFLSKLTEFVDIRSVAPLMPQHHSSILALARGLAFWNRRNGYCGTCGAETIPKHGGHQRTCKNNQCALDHFPRIDPAVIMLVTTEFLDEPHCLLGRQPNWEKGMYSSLAGFVESGECLEAAVAREVMEEVGIEITDVTYRASQPWPFPSSLMLGFNACAVTSKINIGDNELEEALWFSYSEIYELSQINRKDKRLPRHDSIARWLIDDWINSSKQR